MTILRISAPSMRLILAFSVAMTCCDAFRIIPNPMAARDVMAHASPPFSHVETVTSDASAVSSSNNTSEPRGVVSNTSGDEELIKKQLLLIASRSDRGQSATADEREIAGRLVSTLERANTNPTPAALGTEASAPSSALGTWELVYSSTQLFRSSPFFMAGRAVCRTEEEAEQYDWFCDMHRAALAISTIGKVRQIISRNRIVSEFEVKVGSVPFLSDFTPFAYSGGLPFTIDGSIVSSADIEAVNNGTAWEIFMDTVEIKGSNIPLVRQVLDRGLKLQSRNLGSFLETNVKDYSNPRPIFRTTFLDDNIRVSRDQDGKIFVYCKVSNNTSPTDYDGVLADLGIGKLLEGFNDAVAKIYL